MALRAHLCTLIEKTDRGKNMWFSDILAKISTFRSYFQLGYNNYTQFVWKSSNEKNGICSLENCKIKLYNDLVTWVSEFSTLYNSQTY